MTSPAIHRLRGDGHGAPDRRVVVTPEGVPLSLRLADAGDRAAAFLVDAVLIVGAATALGLVTVIAVGLGRDLGTAFAYVAVFLLRNFYFTWFESRWGASPGKRLLGLRVVDARGGALTTEAVFARNLVREVEVFGPLTVLTAPDSIWPGAPAWTLLLAGAWLLVLGALPLFNKDRLRMGDLIAGTLVVRLPRASLRHDLSDAPEPAAARFRFTDAQLEIYGNYELQVLEDILRRPGRAADRARADVARKIKERIEWPGSLRSVDIEPFLAAFYTAQRARLEQKMLLGRAQARKRPRGRASRTP
jgi:uncharacterized RDD family membrane protein YckC